MIALLFLVTSIFMLNGQVLAAPPANPAQAAEAAILPFLDALASPPSGSAQAFVIKGRVESVNSLSFTSAPPAFEFALEAPNRLRIQFPLGQSLVTACRDDQRLWAAPASELQPFLSALPKTSDKGVSLKPIQIPFSGKQLELFPALLQILPKGSAQLDNIPCEVVDVRILPQLAKLLPSEVENWALRLWLSPEKRPIRIGLQFPGGSTVLRIDHVQFLTSLPPEFWRPTPDSLPIPSSRLQSVLNAFGRNSEAANSQNQR